MRIGPKYKDQKCISKKKKKKKPKPSKSKEKKMNRKK